jgi:hypothetical protein
VDVVVLVLEVAGFRGGLCCLQAKNGCICFERFPYHERPEEFHIGFAGGLVAHEVESVGLNGAVIPANQGRLSKGEDEGRNRNRYSWLMDADVDGAIPLIISVH